MKARVIQTPGALAAFTFALFVATVAAAAEPSLLDKNGNPAGFRALELGERAPDFNLPGIDGRSYSLSDFAEFDVLMVLFTSNHCPTSHSIEQRLQKLRADFSDRSFGLVAINPNHPDGIRIDELGYGEFNDSFEDMKPYAELNGWDFPYLYDGDKQLTARAYGCLATPHVFVFDKERRLRYAGRFDDSRFLDESTVSSPDARNALEDLFAGRPVAAPLTRPHGCSTKWREKHTGNVAIMEAWKEIPVSIDTIDAEGVAALRDNPTNKYRLVNLWATWCAPCVEEFPTLVSISRQYNMRDFELITISLDDPKQQAKAKAFLQRQGAGLTKSVQRSVDKEGRKTNHYLFTGANQDALTAALDPDWPGPLPHTVLIAPGGEIIWRHNGIIDGAEARSAIATALTRYYSP
ncbi:MAG: redoxin domain-containing protein [Opitutaceae bacterium]